MTSLTPSAVKLPPTARRLSPAAASEFYGVSKTALKKAWQDRRLPYYRVGHRTILLDAADVENFLNRCRVDALHG